MEDDDRSLAPPVTPGAVADNYLHYEREHFGYQYDAEELMAPEERRIKARLTHISDAELVELVNDLTRSNPLITLHIAHACLQRAWDARTLDLLEQVLAYTPYHAAIAYDEVCSVAMKLALDAGDVARGEAAFERGAQILGEAWTQRRMWHGVLCWERAERAEACEHWEAFMRADERVDPERAYEIAAVLLERGLDEARKETASDFLRRSELAAEERGARAVLVDIALLRAAHGLSA